MQTTDIKNSTTYTVQKMTNKADQLGYQPTGNSPYVHSPAEPSSTESFIQQATAFLGPVRLLAQQDVRLQYSKTTLPRSTTPVVVAKPKNKEEVSALVSLAKKHQIEWHAISKGKNWGYGDRCAEHDGFLIIDLSLMNQIVEINEELAYAVVEPGVSQGQLYKELIARQSRLMLDVTGAGPDASIVGNVLQRGFGHTPHGDRTAHSCNYEAVLADGSITYTGFGEITESKVGHVYPYGQGPNHQGMLAQSRSGIVTRMTIWLMPRPECITGFAFKTDDSKKFIQIVNRIRQLRQNGTIDSVVHMANDLRVVSSQPWIREYQHDTVFSEEDRHQFRNRAGICRWNGLGGIYGSRSITKAKKKDIQAALRDLCQVRFVGKRLIQLMNTGSNLLPAVGRLDQLRSFTTAVTDVYDLLSGKPTTNHLQGAFYRNRPASGEIIDAGLIWIAPVIPFTGEHAERLVGNLEPIANQFGFDFPITISPVVSSAAVCISNISYDKNDQAQSSRAIGCYRAISKCLKNLGYPPYRSASVPLHH